MIHISQHAIERYQERIANVPDEVAREALSCPAVIAAADFGASSVRLGSGVRIVLVGRSVVTVLPKTRTFRPKGVSRDD